MLGHRSVTTTLGLYRHLFPDQLDDIADLVDAGRASAARARRPAGVDSLR